MCAVFRRNLCQVVLRHVRHVLAVREIRQRFRDGCIFAHAVSTGFVRRASYLRVTAAWRVSSGLGRYATAATFVAVMTGSDARSALTRFVLTVRGTLRELTFAVS